MLGQRRHRVRRRFEAWMSRFAVLGYQSGRPKCAQFINHRGSTVEGCLASNAGREGPGPRRWKSTPAYGSGSGRSQHRLWRYRHQPALRAQGSGQGCRGGTTPTPAAILGYGRSCSSSRPSTPSSSCARIIAARVSVALLALLSVRDAPREHNAAVSRADTIICCIARHEYYRSDTTFRVTFYD